LKLQDHGHRMLLFVYLPYPYKIDTTLNSSEQNKQEREFMRLRSYFGGNSFCNITTQQKLMLL
jgi:hypothetical protein